MAEPLKDRTLNPTASRREQWARTACRIGRAIRANDLALLGGIAGVALAAAGIFTGDTNWLAAGLIVEGISHIFYRLHCPPMRL